MSDDELMNEIETLISKLDILNNEVRKRTNISFGDHSFGLETHTLSSLEYYAATHAILPNMRSEEMNFQHTHVFGM